MKIALLADIHGNIEALKAVLKDIERIPVGMMLVAGDFIGYYYHPQEVVSVLKGLEPIAVKGNHDIYLESYDPRNASACEKLRSKYGSGLARAHAELKSDQKTWLSGLGERVAVRVGGKSILLCHGSPWNGDQYIYPDSPEEIFHKMHREKSEIIIMGHTHYPFYQEKASKLVINPGSVGQARNGSQGANWALLDTDNMKVEIRTVKYDARGLMEETSSIDPDIQYLGSVLRRGEGK